MMKPKTAVALSRIPGVDAPIIVAKGHGELARHILSLAREAGVPVREDAVLTGLLDEQDVGSCIPEQTYRAVAALLAFLYNSTDTNWFSA